MTSVAEAAERVGAGGAEAAAEGATEQAVSEAVGEVAEADELPTDAGQPSLFQRLQEPLQGSIYEAEVGEVWNPEQGGENRLLLVAEEVGGLDGIPRGLHVVIALAELWVRAAADQEGSADPGADDRDDDDDAAGQVSQSTREVLNYEP